MCRCSVAVQHGIQFFILTVHFNTFGVEVNGVVIILLSKLFISFIFVNFCNCYNIMKNVYY